MSETTTTTRLLEVNKLTRNFGGLTAVFEASLHIEE